MSARVVLSSGKVVDASRTKNADLFWALQGAGHNFGIVTSLEVKTHDIPSNWTVYSLIYPSEKLESLFSLLNDFEGPSIERPAKLALTGVFVKIPDVDPVNVSSSPSYCIYQSNLKPARSSIHRSIRRNTSRSRPLRSLFQSHRSHLHHTLNKRKLRRPLHRNRKQHRRPRLLQERKYRRRRRHATRLGSRRCAQSLHNLR